MKFTRYLALFASALFASALLAAPAEAVGPSQSVLTYAGQSDTYSAAKLGLAPVASATDFFTITGASGVSTKINRISCNGISTAAATAVVQVVKRSTANSAGSSTTSTAVPYDSVIGVAAASTVRSYTGNPTLGTAIGTVAVGELTTNTVATSAFNNASLVFDFSNQHVILNGPTEVLALNANGASFTSGASLNCSVEWSE